MINFPDSPTVGQTHTAGKTTWTWDGTAWTASAGSSAPAGGASVSIGDTPPANPKAGDLWWDSANGVLAVWFVDANTSQWVDAVPSGPGMGQADADARYMNVTGDTMTGALTFGVFPGGAIQTHSDGNGSSGIITTDFGAGASINLQHLFTGGMGRSRFTTIGAGLTGGASPLYIDLRSDTNISRSDGMLAQFITVSDARVKSDIVPATFDALAAILALGTVSFSWAPGTPYEGLAPVQVGFTAQDMQAHIPDAVKLAPVLEGAPTDTLLVDTPLLIPYLVRAIQQLAARVEKLEARK